MYDLADPRSRERRAIENALAMAENNAALALKDAVTALIAWGDALAAFKEGKISAAEAVDAEDRFNAARRARIEAEETVADIRRTVRG